MPMEIGVDVGVAPIPVPNEGDKAGQHLTDVL